MSSPDEIQKKEYAARLYERRGEGVLLKRAEVSIGEWKPLPNHCHHNVTEWCTQDDRYKPVRGWLYFDLTPNLVKFVSHSAVRAPDGNLYDITPTPVPRSYPFVPAVESEEEYAVLNESGTTELWHGK